MSKVAATQIINMMNKYDIIHCPLLLTAALPTAIILQIGSLVKDLE